MEDASTPNPKNLTKGSQSEVIDNAAALQKINSDIQSFHENKSIRMECLRLANQNKFAIAGEKFDAAEVVRQAAILYKFAVEGV